MNRLERSVFRMSALAGVIIVGAAFAMPAADPPPANARGGAIISVGGIASQLGVKVPYRNDDEFSLGVQFTGTLVDPAKLAAFGISGMHAGARVIAARIRPDIVYVEADELEPPSRASAQLRLDTSGKLVKPAKESSPD